MGSSQVSPPLARELDELLARDPSIWESLRGERLFVTGGTGFFGKWLLDSFVHANRALSLGAEALVLSRDPDAFLRGSPHLAGAKGLSFHRGDVRNFAFPEGRFGAILHGAAAASAALNQDQPLVMFDTVLEGTRRTLEFAKSCGAGRLLFLSSGAVYGRQPPELTHLSEDFRGGPDPLQPGSAYAEAKRAAEYLCSAYAHACGFELKIARCFAFVGPHLPLDIHFAIGNFIRDGLQGGVIRVNGDGTPYRSYLYASDLTEWLWTILARGRSGRPYNVGSPEGLPISEIARQVAACFDHPVSVEIAGSPEPGKPIERYVPSVQRAESELGLKVRVALPEAIRRTIDWHRRRSPK